MVLNARETSPKEIPMTYQPLTLKAQTDANGAKVKVGKMSRTAPGSGGEYSVLYLVNVRTEGKRNQKVFVQVGDKVWVAGRLYWFGVGRYGIASNTVEVKDDGTLYSARRVSNRQPRGYEHQGTIALCAERVVHEFLQDLEYRTAKAASATTQEA